MKILPVFISHLGCPFNCIYCDQRIITKSHSLNLKKIDSLVADFCHYNKALTKEIAFYGGTFTNLEPKMQKSLLQIIEKYSDPKTTLRISTRPDCIDDEKLKLCHRFNVNCIELGIQSFSNQVLLKSGRGYTQKQAIQACRSVKEKGFKLSIQLMPGLPGSDWESWLKTQKLTLQLAPDYVRIYPTIVLKGTRLEVLYKKRIYTPLKLLEAIELCSDMVYKLRKTKIRIIKLGLHSDIDHTKIVAGPYHQNFGELVKSQLLIKEIIANFETGKSLILSQSDTHLLKGFGKSGLKRLKNVLNLQKIPIILDNNLPSGNFSFTSEEAMEKW